MAVNTKAIKRRLGSVKNTKKITKAMELVSAAKMRRAVEAALNTRTYATMARELMAHLAHIDDPNFELLETRPVKNVLVVLVSSNRGLCGSFNANISKRTKELLLDIENVARHRVKGAEDIMPEKDVAIHIIGVGKKSATFAKRNGYNLVAVFDKLADKPSLEQVLPISAMLTEEYKEKKYDKVMVAYMDYKTSLTQEPKIRQLLPLSIADIEKMSVQAGRNPNGKKYEEEEETDFPIESYLFEPDAETILEYVLPRLVEIQLYQAVLESSASEHSSRMMAMRNASDSASDMIDSLNLTYNKARQAAITQEIAEIAGGAAALG